MTLNSRSASCTAMVIVAFLLMLLSGCSRVSVPKVSLPKLPDLGSKEVTADTTATPRDLLTARLLNPRANPNTPNMTVGKMIEFADRYLACDCATTRFVRSWEKTAEGYLLQTNSEVVKPLEFICRAVDNNQACYLTEIDRGPNSASLTERFVPGSEFIQFLYDNGVQCQRDTPCP